VNLPTGRATRVTLDGMSRGEKTPKSKTQKSRAAEKDGLGSKPSGRNIQAPAKQEDKPASDGPAIPDPSRILAGETFRSRKPSEWRLRPRRNGR
jgi:hypothetical protein